MGCLSYVSGGVHPSCDTKHVKSLQMPGMVGGWYFAAIGSRTGRRPGTAA
ncbi:hypothetical protein SXCC_01217 [Gluconacetobacter sp. SXCC-1]|nr:hypothetical protein SXCC_01217 [Gluconacetobacter sp. SXCC-1]